MLITDQIIIDNEVIHGLCDTHFTDIRNDFEERTKIQGSERDWITYSLEEAINCTAQVRHRVL